MREENRTQIIKKYLYLLYCFCFCFKNCINRYLINTHIHQMNIYKLMQIVEIPQLKKEKIPRSSSIETTPEDKSFTFKITKQRSPWSIEVRQ